MLQSHLCALIDPSRHIVLPATLSYFRISPYSPNDASALGQEALPGLLSWTTGGLPALPAALACRSATCMRSSASCRSLSPAAASLSVSARLVCSDLQGNIKALSSRPD